MANSIAESIPRNHEDLVLRYKAVINDGIRLPLEEAIKLEKERAFKYYEEMPPEMFAQMQKFISGQSSKKTVPSSKL